MSVICEIRKDREELARVLKKHSGIRRIVEDLYPDKAHFIYELLQNAEDRNANAVRFLLRPDRLLFEHNGEPFRPEHISAITDIGEGTKANDDDKIGRFGVGFKAVFAYSETPCIFSPTFSFMISDLVVPTEVPAVCDLNGRTRFEFPFNNPKKAAVDAFREIQSSLEELAETTLLFLRHIESICWTIDGGDSSDILRVTHGGGHISILKSLAAGGTSSLHFLKFERPVEGLLQQSVAVAFPLDFLPNKKGFVANQPLCNQLKIVPAAGRVAVFFPANKETSGLRFHLHAPFVPELSRASIKETPANAPLFAQLAALVSSSLHAIREQGLLTTDFLGVLPNPQDQLGRPYECIRDAIVAAMNNEDLTPTYLKTHAPARFLYQAKVSLKELLSSDDIERLIEYEDEPPQWAANRALQGTNAERFMNGLSMRDWDVEAFVGQIIKEATENVWNQADSGFMAWLGEKDADWHQRFYALLEKEADARSKNYNLGYCKIVRLSDGSYATGSACHFPDAQGPASGIRCVDQAVYMNGKSKAQQESVRRFLESIGVTAIGERQLVEAILRSYYGTEPPPLTRRDHTSHMRRFMKLLDEDESCLPLLSSSALFLGSDRKWHKASEIYLDVPYLDTGLSECLDIIQKPQKKAPLNDVYKALPIDMLKIAQFAEKLGAQTGLEVTHAFCRENPDFDHLRRAPGERYTSPIDSDYVIAGFDLLVAKNSEKLARLIWRTMFTLPVSRLRAVYRKNERGGAHYADSQLVHQLRAAAWVPQMGQFVCPTQARPELLPEGFTFDAAWPWIKAIKFGQEIQIADARVQAEIAAAAGRRQVEIAAARSLGFHNVETARKLAEIPVDVVLRMHAEWERRKNIELPEHVPANSSRRSCQVIARASEAPLRQTEQRTRSVSVGRDVVKVETDPYLRQQYTNADDAQFCQICKDVLPFKLDSGEYFFEAVELIPALRKHHVQNYLCLCPNHAAMFRFANGSRSTIKEIIRTQSDNEVPVVLARCEEAIYFTKRHLADLQDIIKSDEGDEVPDDDRQLSAAN
jgi:hypothetical protein